MTVPKRESMVEGIEEVIVSLYAKGMSVSDIEEQIKDVYKFEVSILTDMKAHGLEHILITATDNLNGFTQTIRSVFPQSATQICVVHELCY